METKHTESNFLNNSIYLKDFLNKTHKFNKTEQIMIEEPAISQPINDSLRIKPMSDRKMPYRDYCQGCQYILPNCLVKQIEGDKKQRDPISRLCRQNFQKAIEDCDIKQTIVDQNWRRKRDVLAAKAKMRKENAFQHLRERVHEILVFQMTEQTQSEIRQQTYEEQEMKQVKVQNFILRQQFANKQKQILREMREFCQYGTIKLE